jgi:DNA polymerase III subunit beta
MKFVIEKGVLLRELALIQQSVIDKRNTIPALSHVRIEASGKRAVRLAGTDLDQTLQCEIEGRVQKAGVCALPGKKLFEIIRQLPDAEVRFESKEGDRVLVTCERAQFKLAGMNPKDLPELPVFKESSAQLPADVVRQMIERTRFCITQEESRYTLSGAKFILRKKGVRMVATDGHRLALIDNRAIRSEHEFDVLIPKGALAAVSRLAAAHEGAVGINCDENHVYFEIGARTLVARLLTGVFPNYEMVIPKENDNKVDFDCAALLQVVRRVSVMTDERSRALRLEFTKNKLTVRSEEDGQGAAEETLEIEYAGAPTVIGINHAYLAEYLSVLGGGAIRFEFKDGKTQVQIRPLGEAGYNSFNIIMPMNLGDAAPAAASQKAAKAFAEEEPAPEEAAPVEEAA